MYGMNGRDFLGQDYTAARRWYIFDMHTGVVLFPCRIYVALGRADSEAVEYRSRRLAASLANALQTTSTCGRTDSANLGVGDAILATGEAWAACSGANLGERQRKLISPSAFRRFANLVGCTFKLQDGAI